MEQIWWERVPNAMTFIHDVTQSLLEEKSIVIQYADAFPWRDAFIDRIRDSIMEVKAVRSFCDVPETDNPGEYLFRNFCKPEKRDTFRPPKTHARFLAESDDIVLHQRYLLIRAETPACVAAWEKFISEYFKARGKGREAAVFILFRHGGRTAGAVRGLREHSFDDAVTEFDRIVFASLAASSVRVPQVIKNYLKELAADLVGNDIELCAQCLERYEDFLHDPYGVMCSLSCGELPSEEEIQRRIWLAQIRAIYPRLEEYREALVRKYNAAIAGELPIESSSGEVIEDPKDVELGALFYMANGGKILLPEAEYKKLYLCKEARNRLSHLGVLTYEEIQDLPAK